MLYAFSRFEASLSQRNGKTQYERSHYAEEAANVPLKRDETRESQEAAHFGPLREENSLSSILTAS